MAYFPVQPDVFRPGMPGNQGDYSLTLDNVDAAVVDYGPPIFGPAACSLEATTTSDEIVCEIDLPDNQDNVPVYCRIWWRGTTGHTATVTFEIDDYSGPVDTDTDTNTATAYSATTLLITPTSLNTPRVARLYLRTSTLGQVAHIANVVFGYATPLSYPTEMQPSGIGIFNSAWGNDNYPIPSEVIERAHNNLRAVAQSRPAGLAGGITRVTTGGTPSSGPVYEVTGTTWTQVERWLQPGSDEGRRWYRLCVLLGGDDPELRMTIGPYLWEVFDAGWHETVVQLSLNEGMRCGILLRSSSGSTAILNTWQVQRARPAITYPPVAVLYRSPGASGDYAYAADGTAAALAFDGSDLGLLAMSVWVRGAVGADASISTVVAAGDPVAPRLHCDFAGGELNFEVEDDAAGPPAASEVRFESFDDDWHHLFLVTRCEANPTIDGVQIWYDGDTLADGAPFGSAPTFATAAAALRLFADAAGDNRLAGDLANVAFFRTLPTNGEIIDLALAGVTHDPRNATGRWRRRQPIVQWRDADTAGVVADAGSAGTCHLTFNGDVTSEAL